MTVETMSNTEATSEACSVENDETENCQPCLLQDKKVPAEYWCPDCTELLCKSCYGHHRVLKATKNHVPYTLEEYLLVRDVIKIDLMCKSHSDLQLDFFCKCHQSLCCGVCKSEHLLPSCDVQAINTSVIGQEKDQLFQKNEMVTNDLHLRMKNVLLEKLDIKATLEQHHKTFYEEIKRSRQEIEMYLDQFEENIKTKFEEQFGISQTALMQNITEIESRCKEVVKRQSVIEKLKQCHKIPAVADFHTWVLIMRGNEEDKAFLKTISPVEFICYEAVSLVDKKMQLITLNEKSQKYNFSKDDKNFVVCEHTEYEDSSSTVETEAVILSEENAQHYKLSSLDSKHPSTSKEEPGILSDTIISTCAGSETSTQNDKDSAQPDKLSSLDPEHPSALQEVVRALSDTITNPCISSKTSTNTFLSNDDRTLGVCEYAQYKNFYSIVKAKAVILREDSAQPDKLISLDSEHPSASQEEARALSDTITGTDSETSMQEECFEKTHSFYIQKYKKDIDIVCVRIMCNGKILMTETSENRLLAYYENGQKVGEVKFDKTPNNIAIIYENRVAVTVHVIVFIVDTDDFEIVKAINMHDVCFGIAFANDKLFVNCCYKGLTIMLPSGDLIRTIPFIKGRLNLFVLGDDTIMSVKQAGQTVFQFNMRQNSTQKLNLSYLSKVNDIVHDGLNSAFVLSADNEIWKLNYQTGVWKEVLNETNGLDFPCSIDFNKQNNKLIVSNNNGRSLFFYKCLQTKSEDT